MSIQADTIGLGNDPAAMRGKNYTMESLILAQDER